MNKLHLFLAIGLVILFFGCTEGKTGTDPKEVALSLARETPEGGLAYALKGSFDLTPKCTETEYKGKVAVISPFLQKYGVSLDTDESTAVEESKTCDPKIKEEIEQNGNIYVVSYSFEVSPTCALEGAKDANGEHFVEIEIDPKSKNANVVKGKFDEDGADKASQVKLFLPLAGNCLAPLLLSTAYLKGTLSADEGQIGAIDRKKASEIVITEIIGKLPEAKEAEAYMLPELLKSGDTISYANDRIQFKDISVPKDGAWLFWIDKKTNTRLGNTVIIGIVNAKTGTVQTYTSTLWPYVSGQLILGETVLDKWKEYNIFYRGQYAAFGEAINVPVAILEMQKLLENDFGNCANKGSKKKAIVIYATPKGALNDVGIKQDAIHMYNLLCSYGYDTKQHASNNEGEMLNWLSDELGKIEDSSHQPGKSLNNFFFYVVSHGDNITGDLGLDYSNATHIQKLHVADLAALLGPAAWDPNAIWAESHTMIQDSCHSGYAVDDYQNAAAANGNLAQGWVFASTQGPDLGWTMGSVNLSWNSTSIFTKGILDCFKPEIKAAPFFHCVQSKMDDYTITSWGGVANGYWQNASYAKLTASTPVITPVTPK